LIAVELSSASRQQLWEYVPNGYSLTANVRFEKCRLATEGEGTEYRRLVTFALK